MIIINNAPFWLWSSLTLLIALVWTRRYKNAMRKLYKPGFWIFFITITMLTTLLFSSMQNGDDRWIQGLITGVQMNFRAIIVIIGFSALGRELYNPKLFNYFQKSAYRQLHVALELSFESIPQVIGYLPGVKTFFKDPLASIRMVIQIAENQLESLKNSLERNTSFYFITGDIAEGKSNFLQSVIAELKTREIPMHGFFAERMMEGNITRGYAAVDVNSGELIKYMGHGNFSHTENIGRYHLIKEGYQAVLRNIHPKNVRIDELVILDEIGNLELKDKGWAPGIHALLHENHRFFLLVCRKRSLQDILRKWFISEEFIFEVSNNFPRDIAQKIEQDYKSNINS
jgi:nucleoside-triphosphatase THEP1